MSGDTKGSVPFSGKSVEVMRPGLVAYGRVQGDGTLDGNSVGVSGAAKNATGSYTVTLDSPGLPTTERYTSLTVVANGGSPASAIILDTSVTTDDTRFSVATLNPAGAAADSIFEFAVYRIAGP
jgi:hypothetical protein